MTTIPETKYKLEVIGATHFTRMAKSNLRRFGLVHLSAKGAEEAARKILCACYPEAYSVKIIVESVSILKFLTQKDISDDERNAT